MKMSHQVVGIEVESEFNINFGFTTLMSNLIERNVCIFLTKTKKKNNASSHVCSQVMCLFCLLFGMNEKTSSYTQF